LLRGDVDNFGLRLRRIHSIENTFPSRCSNKQFFAGELECCAPCPSSGAR